METILEVTVGKDSIAKVQGIVRSYPKGISVEQIQERFGFNTNTVRAALHILEERGEVKRINPDKYISKIYL